jgi:hypothetical protein
VVSVTTTLEYRISSGTGHGEDGSKVAVPESVK